jgi:transposase
VDRVVIGVGPHKRPVTFEARDSREILRAKGQFGTDARSYRQLLAYARQWPERIWAVEGANGIGRPLAQRLLASGERVLDVRRSVPPGRGCSPPARAARPTPPMRTRS